MNLLRQSFRQINVRKNRKMVGRITPLLSQLNDLRIVHSNYRRDKNIIKLEAEKKPAISMEGGYIAMMRISFPESVR